MKSAWEAKAQTGKRAVDKREKECKQGKIQGKGKVAFHLEEPWLERKE